MKHRTFFWFIFPSALAMILFIALLVVSVFIQSLHVIDEQVPRIVENCGPIGGQEEPILDRKATRELRAAKSLGRSAGFSNCLDCNHPAITERRRCGSARTVSQISSAAP